MPSAGGLMAKGLFFDINEVTPHLKKFLPAIDAGVSFAFDSMVPVAESYMRTNAPWTDRTGNARNGLRAKHEDKPMESHELILYHTVPYGIWLEVRWSGKYAIIAPSIVELGPDLMARVVAAAKQAIQLVG